MNNKCFRAKRKCVGHTLSEAEEKMKSRTLFAFMPKSTSSATPSTAVVSNEDSDAASEDKVSAKINDSASLTD